MGLAAAGLGTTLGVGIGVSQALADSSRQTVRSLADLVPLRPDSPTTAWSAGRRLHLDLGELPDPDGWAGRIGPIEDAARAHAGVDAAHIEPALGRLVVDRANGADDDVLWQSVLAAAEDPAGDAGRSDAAELRPIADPGNRLSVIVPLAAAAIDLAALTGALTGKLLLATPAPPSLRAAATLLKHQPQVSRFLEPHLGDTAVGLILHSITAAADGLSQAPGSTLLDLSERLLQSSEALAHRQAWIRREPGLARASRPQTPASTLPRLAAATAGRAGRDLSRAGIDEAARGLVEDVSADLVEDLEAITGNFVDGAVEDYAGLAANLSLATAGAMWVGGRRDMVSESIIASAPKAAKLGREAFCAVLGRRLAEENVLVLDPAALRRLDRVEVVVIDGAATRSSALTVLDAWPLDEAWGPDRVWVAATAALAAHHGARSDPADPVLEWPRGQDPAGRDATSEARLMDPSTGLAVGAARIGHELDHYAVALIQAARRGGARVVLRQGPGTEDLTSGVSKTRPADLPLLDIVREERRKRGPVLLVAAARPSHDGGDAHSLDVLEALAAADVSVAIDDPRACAPWTADIIAGPGLAPAIPILAAIRGAREAAENGVTLSKGGSTLAALLVITRQPAAGKGLGLQRWLSPVNAAGASAVVTGAVMARSLMRAPAPIAQPLTAWHTLDAAVVFSRLDAERPTHPAPLPAGPLSLAHGLLTRAPLAHSAVGGVARLASATIRELNDPMTPILAVGAAASAILGGGVDAILVGGVMATNAMIGGAQHIRAENASAALFEEQTQQARRLRMPDAAAPAHRLFVATSSDELELISAAELRPGDVIELRAPDVVPADARILAAEDLELDESSLTGESVPVAKAPAAVTGKGLSARTSMVYESTTVVTGRARAVVVAVGPGTAAQRAAASIPDVGPTVGVQARLHELTSTILPLTMAGGALVTGLSLLRNAELQTAIADGVAIAVAAVPEGLPLVATVAQLASARRLSRRGILVRSPRTIEALGRIDTVCFDKTGTLTTNELAVVAAVPASFPLTPEALAADFPALDGNAAQPVLRAAGRACPDPDSAHGRAHATDDAVSAAARRWLGPDELWELLAEVPFESSRGYAAAIGANGAGPEVVFKGAPEVLLPRVRAADAAAGEAIVQAMAERGLRVLAVARQGLADDFRAPDFDDPDFDAVEFVAETFAPDAVTGEAANGLELIGFVGLADTPRPSARPLIERLVEAGQQVVLITGDHPVTAVAIARQLGLPPEARVVTGDELELLDEDARAELAVTAQVFARVTPEQKVQVVAALQHGGRVTAMIGDGANDAAAIRTADVGIGIASRGSSAARGAADLVLTNGDLTVLLDALVEGRNMWRGVRDALVILLGGNAGEVAFTVAGTAIAGQAPIGTRQLLLVNLLTDMFPALAVAVTPRVPDPDEVADPAMTETERNDARDTYRREILDAAPASLGKPLMAAIVSRGAVTATAATVAWQIGRWTPGTARRSSTMGLATLVGTQLAQTLLTRYRSPLVVGTSLGSAAVLVALVQTPGVSHFFGCTPLGPVAWSTVLGTTTVASAASLLMPHGAPTESARTVSTTVRPALTTGERS